MSKKRDEMARDSANYYTPDQGGYYVRPNTETIRAFKAGWDAAIQNDERVLALEEKIKAILDLHSPLPGELSEYGEGARDAWKMINEDITEALTQWKETP